MERVQHGKSLPVCIIRQAVMSVSMDSMGSLTFNVPLEEAKDRQSFESFGGCDDLTRDADLCIVCKDGIRLFVHRLIMSKWSHVISECPGIQNPSQATGLLDFSVEESAAEWRELLGVIYPSSPVTILDWDNVGRIFSMADKYAMQGIAQRCQAFLLSPNAHFSTSRLRNDYVLKWLAFAAQYHEKALADKCMQFVRVHYRSIEELRSSPERCYLRDVLSTTSEGVGYIIEILQFVMQQRR